MVAVAAPPIAVADEVTVDGFGGNYDPSLYRHHGIADGVHGFDAVTDEQVALYHEQGFLIIHDAFSPQEVQDSLDGMLDLIDGKHPGFRGIQFEAAAKQLLPALSRDQKQDIVRKISHFVEYDARLLAMAQHPRLLEVMSRLIGAVPGLYENKALLKPPRVGREKPWHQDLAYWNLPLDAKIGTAWIALDHATIENGCLFVIPGSHREGPVVHFRRRDWQICDDRVETDRVMAAPLAPGGVLIFDSLLQHGTPSNDSNLRRRALQFVYIPAGLGRIPPAERLAVFGSEGKDVTC